MKDRVIVFGTGSVSEYILKKIDMEKAEIIAFCNEDDSFDEFCGKKCIRPEQINDYNYDYILVASGYVKAIIGKLNGLGISANKLVGFIFDESETYKELAGEIKVILNNKYQRNVLERWLVKDERISDIYPSIIWDDKHTINCIEKDFVREATVKMISEIIKEQKNDGAIAELGVYKGDFTVVIDKYFEDQKFYLFDTFNGFDEGNLEDDNSIHNVKGESRKFKDTSVEYVMGRLKNKGRVIVKKGLFPESFDLDESFAFVSVDLNLETPVKAALDIFYPRMIRGGYIMVSDYYAPFYEGSKKAVDEWCKQNNEVFVPVADFYGSVLIIKK